jgi:hypothetical protein
MYVFFLTIRIFITKFQKLMDLLNTKGNKILCNVKIRQISMFFPSKIIYFEYQPFIVNMHVDNPKSDITNQNLSVLCDVELILGLPCLLPLFECVTSSFKLHKVEMFLYTIL